MRRFILFIKLVLRAKFIFKNPQKYEVVVFDDESMVDFKNFHKVENLNFDISKLKNANSLNITFNSLLNIPLHSAFATFEGMFNYKVRGISKIESPTLIISTTDDPLFSASIEKKLARNIKTSKHIIKKGTHHLIIQKPNEVIKEIEKFIK